MTDTAVELGPLLRWLKPQRRTTPLRRRDRATLNWVEDAPPAGAAILLDTTVYIDVLKGRSPAALDALVSLRPCNHSSVCLSELTHLFGRLDPADPRSPSALRVVAQIAKEIPAHRLSVPDSHTWAAAGVLAGMLHRLGASRADNGYKGLNDALIYLQARKLGSAVVTANLRDFDYLNQLVPDGRVLFYEPSH